jgi:hypothetical protein
VNATQLVALLERDLIRKKEAPSGVFMTEVGSPDGRRRADALFIQWVGGKGIDGYEIKVNRSDLQAELSDPSKVDSWKRYCRRWWLTVPDDKLLDGMDIPEDWGIKVAPSAKNRVAFTVVRPAPLLEPHDIGPALGRIATVWAYRMRDSREDVRRAAAAEELACKRAREMEARLIENGVSAQADTHHVVCARELVAAMYRTNRYTQLPSDEDEVEWLAAAVVDVLDGQLLKAEIARVVRDKLSELDRVISEFGESWYVKHLRKQIEETLVEAVAS